MNDSAADARHRSSPDDAVQGLEVDVVVVGAGLAGHAAALAAAERGAEVCLLEKLAEFGGSSVRAGGGMLFAGTELQEEADVEDDPEELRRAILDTGQARNDTRTVDAYVGHQLETFRWLCRSGVRFTLAPANGNMPVPRLHVAAQDVTHALHDRLRQTPHVTYWPSSAALRLTRTADGRVGGVRVRRADGGEAMVTARSGVVLTTGGFSRSEELLRAFAPRVVDVTKMGGAGNTGDGLRMAAGLGARLVDMGYVEATFGAVGTDRPRLMFAHADGAIVVDQDGRRFADESLSYKTLGRLCAEQPGGIAYQIFDRRVFERSQTRPTPRDYRRALADGLLMEAPTVPALAERLGVDPDSLDATVRRYNQHVRAGADPDFGRPVGAGAIGHGAVDTPPFYGLRCAAGLTATYCGTAVDDRLRVIDVFGDVIPGLYAAGEVVGGFHGAGYLTGTALGKAAVFGHLAGTVASSDAR
ncbi:FAD-dependent oxidoreductase [Streptomyces sp. NPDC088747]|uniref:FAD-dependent oxidoreductase n=1 Tax=Streptomyces sp. NPDC088747 TaxID=3365886 RepID=UPI00382BFF5B